MVSPMPIFHALVLATLLHGSTTANPTYSNRSDHFSSSSSGRLKRSLWKTMPQRLNINIKYTTGEIVNLHWNVVNPELANKYLPVITPFGYMRENVMQEVGDFVLYHDLSKCSAVVYFAKSNVMYGVIGVNHFIDALPFAFDANGKYQLGVIGYPYIVTREKSFFHIPPSSVFPPPSDTEAWFDFFQTTPTVQNQPGCNAHPSISYQGDESMDDGTDEENESSDEDVETITDKNSGIPYYKYHFLEILVLVTTDIAHLFRTHFGDDDYIEWIVIHHIVYFNGVDMMFKNLRTKYGDISINIAKIVIEDELDPFDFTGNGEVQFNKIISAVPQYLQNHQSHFMPDSFDHVFIHTSRSIMDDVMPVNGLSKYGSDLYQARKHDRYYDVVPITIVKYEHDYANYLVAIHEISRTLTLKLDSQSEGLTLVGQCHSLMQREGPKCDNCLKWTANSRKQLRSFLKKNRNRCFLLNEPRSLRRPGASKFMSANRQCKCFGYLTYLVYPNGCPRHRIGQTKCSRPLECSKLDGDRLIAEFTVRPFDGTPATATKVCWNGEPTNAPRWSRPRHFS